MNNISRIIGVFVVGLLLITISCDDVLEEDISDKEITIVFPLEGGIITSNISTLQWNAIDNADNYRVQVLNNNSMIEIDSLVAVNSLAYQLKTGDYSWRVKAENFAYETEFTFPVSFSVEVSDDLETQSIVINTPSDNSYINSTSNNTITWESLVAAESYTLQIDKNTSGAVATIDTVEGLTSASYVIPSNYLDEDASYILKIKAVNSTSETVFSSVTILLDTSLPNTPVLVGPDNNFSTSDTEVLFEWSNGSDSGEVQSPVTSLLTIADDANLTNVIQTYEVGGDDTSQSHVFTNNGDFYWSVKNEDQAGNESEAEEVRKVTIN